MISFSQWWGSRRREGVQGNREEVEGSGAEVDEEVI